MSENGDITPYILIFSSWLWVTTCIALPLSKECLWPWITNLCGCHNWSPITNLCGCHNWSPITNECQFLIPYNKNQLDALISQIYFCNKTLHVSDSSSVHHQEFFTLHTASEQDQDRPSWSCSQAVSKPVCHIPLLCVQWKAPDDRQGYCLNHLELYSKNKFEKLVHLVGLL